jgi:glycosyltransferase involved in cell wall biosynthesis
MRIGIAAPIEVRSLIQHLPGIAESDLSLGLGATAINILIDGFITAGHHVTVFTLDKTIKHKYILEGPQLKIIFGHFRSNSKIRIFDFCSVEFRQINKFIIEEIASLDIVNAHWSYEYAIGAIQSKTPHLITFRDHAQTILKLTRHPYRLTRLLMDSWVRKNGKHFSYNSEYLKSLIGKPGIVIPNPIKNSEIKLARKYPSYKKVIEICFVANGTDYRKNPDAALNAFAVLVNKNLNVQLNLIGGGFEYGGKYYMETDSKGWNNKVKYWGAIKHAQLMLELDRFDIMLHTAREESFGNNLIEAMAKGIPVVGGKSSGAVPWVLENGQSGCLVDVESPNDIAAKLQSLIEDQDYYEKLSINGIANVKKRFSQNAVCDAYIAEYVKIINL